MKQKTFFLKMNDHAEVFVRQWAQIENPVAVVQLAHGMAEHSERYNHFAQVCNKQGIIVIANDHRGHGRTGEKAGTMGYFAPKDGFEHVVDDLHVINLWIQDQYPKLPVFMMGHSMGSFLTRRYLQKYGNTLNGAILMGSGGDPGPAAAIGKFIAHLQMKRNPTQPSPFLDRLSFGSFNNSIKNPKTKFDWISRDPKEVQKYLDDPYCGMVCSSGFFYDLFTGLTQIHDPSLNKKIPKHLPILIVSGEADPVGKHGKGVKEFVSQYQKQGLTNLKTILYPGARHELLNEINKDVVISDICQWLQEQLKD